MKWINSSRVSLAMSGTALFVALGGTAVAVSQVGTQQIRNGAVASSKLKNGAVTNAKIKAGAVGRGKLANGAVNTTKLADGAVSTAKLADGAVSTAKLGAGAVGSAQVAAGGIATANIADGAITSPKLGTGVVANGNLADAAVSNTKLAANAVTSAKVADGSLTASDVAPNTFLPAHGTADNSTALGGLPANSFLRGTGRQVSGRLVLAPGAGPVEFLELGFGHISGTCVAGAVPLLRFVADLPTENLIATTINSGNSTATNTTDIQTTNALTGGTFYEEPHANTNPQSVTFQAAYNDGTDQLATAWTTAQDEGGSCVFTGQAFTTLG